MPVLHLLNPRPKCTLATMLAARLQQGTERGLLAARCPCPLPLPAATLPPGAGASPLAALSRAVLELEALAAYFTGTSDISKVVFILAWNEDKYFRNFLDNIKFKISSKLK